MPKKVALDQQIFEDIQRNGLFYVDKTDFIRQWWTSEDRVTLILRPRRFGKTLMLSTVEQFLSTNYAGRSDLFEGLDVWKDADMRALQGTVPVIALSFAAMKPSDNAGMITAMNYALATLFSEWRGVLVPDLEGEDLALFGKICIGMDAETAKQSLNLLSRLLARHFGRKVVILLDEYDTPLTEAWTKGFRDEAAEFMRGLFNAAFKTNPWLERALLTGITRVGRESMFSDLNNLAACSVLDDQYATSFGFTEAEVFAAMEERGLTDFAGVKRMYDGFTIGRTTDIYNPWSITCFLRSGGRLEPWWANTSSNAMVGELVRRGGVKLKQQFTELMEGRAIRTAVDERIAFSELENSPEAVWSLLLAAGYLKRAPSEAGLGGGAGRQENPGIQADGAGQPASGDAHELLLTNDEVRIALEKLVRKWFAGVESYGAFLDALMRGDLDDMNEYMNDVAADSFSFFDTGGPGGDAKDGTPRSPSARTLPERFYHGFVLGLLADLRGRYVVTSNRESGFGRYDVMLEPLNPARDDAFIFEFKVHKPSKEKSLEDTVAGALAQIEERRYDQTFIARGIAPERIRKYGFAFRGKEVLIGRG